MRTPSGSLGVPHRLGLEERPQALETGRGPPVGLDGLAAAASRSAQETPSAPAAPERSMALTSICDASHGATSAVRPVSTLTTPPGTSEVASTSDSVTAGNGRCSLASTTTV